MNLINNDKELKEFITYNGIPKEIFNHADKMDLSITDLFKDKIINNYSEKNLVQVTSNLLGVYGNYIATYYYNRRYGNSLNEVPIYDEEGKEITKADVVFTDNDGIKNYCEVKASPWIIHDGKIYVDDSLSKKEKQLEIIKYKRIGKKLVTQASKLTKENSKVNVVVFKGCIIDDKIKDKLDNLGVNIHTLNMDIVELEEYIKNTILSIKMKLITSNININKPKLLMKH